VGVGYVYAFAYVFHFLGYGVGYDACGAAFDDGFLVYGSGSSGCEYESVFDVFVFVVFGFGSFAYVYEFGCYAFGWCGVAIRVKGCWNVCVAGD